MKYKKVPNNENAIEIDGKIILSFDPKYKEYLSWRDENQDLEKKLVEDLNREVEKKRLYNTGMPHKDSNIWKWYNRDGQLILTCGMEDGKKSGEETAYYSNGKLRSIFCYENDIRSGKSKTWHESGKKESESSYKYGLREGKSLFYDKDGNKEMECYYVNGIIDGKVI